MNGYQRPPLDITFDSPELEGLVVYARRLTVAESRTLMAKREEATQAERDQTIEKIVAGAVHSWNYRNEQGDAVEPTAENLDSEVDAGLVSELVDALLRKSNRVAPPLPKPSDSGSPSEEDFELMEALSSVPPSSSGPS